MERPEASAGDPTARKPEGQTGMFCKQEVDDSARDFH